MDGGECLPWSSGVGGFGVRWRAAALALAGSCVSLAHRSAGNAGARLMLVGRVRGSGCPTWEIHGDGLGIGCGFGHVGSGVRATW
eukprot:10785895-Alexandrium_andersonii.AAC.1